MTSKAVKRTPLKYSVSRNIRQNRDNTDKALLLFGSEEVTGPSPVISSLRISPETAVLVEDAVFSGIFYVISTLLPKTRLAVISAMHIKIKRRGAP